MVANKAADMSETLEHVAELVPIEDESDFIEAVEEAMKGQKSKCRLKTSLGMLLCLGLLALIADSPFLFRKSL